MEDKKDLFPVLSLNQNITHAIKQIISADISGAVHSGLNNEIKYTDLNSRVHTPAEIVEDPLCGGCYVKLSASYCQYYWLLSDVILKWIDYNVMNEICISNGISMQDLSKQFEQAITLFSDVEKQYGDKFLGNYLNFAESVKDFIVDPHFIDKISKEFSHALELVNCSNEKIDTKDYYCYDMNLPYEQRVNAVYCYGIAFILLHEAAHFQLGHLSEKENYQQEIDADESAMWSIINDLKGQEKFTATCAIILMFFSLMLINPSLEGDGIHPREDIRLFSAYDKLKEENDKYRLLIIGLFKLWSINDPSFPKNLINSDASITEIRNYLERKYSRIKA